MSLEAKRTLVFAILKFLKSELNLETTGPDLKESLEGKKSYITHEIYLFFSRFLFVLF